MTTSAKSANRVEDVASPSSAGDVLRTRQAERVRLYKRQPGEAWTIDHATTRAEGPQANDPMHDIVRIASGFDVPLDIGVHRNLGGLHDSPTPGDVLCAALAACADSTFRQIATKLGLPIEALAVDVEAEVDVRGALCVAPEVPVGFQRMRVQIRARLAGVDERLARKLEEVVEHCCIVLQTLRSGVPVDVTFHQEAPSPATPAD